MAMVPTTAITKAITKTRGLSYAKKPPIVWFFGSGGRDRTYDQLINSQLLYR